MYARVVTSQVKPGKLSAMTRLYENEIVPVIEAQPGFTNLLVLTDPKTNREISVSTWVREADMVAFCDNHLPKWMEHFSELLVAPPVVEVYRVCCRAEAQDIPHKMKLGETSLGLNIEDPLDRNPAVLESELFGAQRQSPTYHSRKFFGKFVGGELRPTPIYGGTTYYEFDELSTELMLQGHF